MMGPSTARFRTLVPLVVAVALGCTSTLDQAPGVGVAQQREFSRARADRQIVRSGDLVVSVDSPQGALPEVERLVEQAGGLVEGWIETRQAQLDRLKSDVELSALSVTLQRERILGPLGYVGWGLWWALSKLFVIR